MADDGARCVTCGQCFRDSAFGSPDAGADRSTDRVQLQSRQPSGRIPESGGIDPPGWLDGARNQPATEVFLDTSSRENSRFYRVRPFHAP